MMAMADKQTILDSIDGSRNLGEAAELYDEAREYWVSHFPSLSWTDLIQRISLPEMPLEEVIAQEIMMKDGIDDAPHAAKMMMTIIVYQMGLG